MNYAQLVAAVQSYTENQFTTTDIDTFIRQAEQRIDNSVQLPNLRRNVTGTATANNKYLQCPDDFLAPYSMAVIDPTSGEYLYLLNKDVNFIRQAYPNPTTDTGIPKYYALFGPTVNVSAVTDELSFIVGPTPDASYAVELRYYYYPESIVDAGTSWLGDNYDPVLLYGSLMEAYTFMKGEQDVMAFYAQKYADALAQLKRLGDGLERGDAYRDGQFKMRVT